MAVSVGQSSPHSLHVATATTPSARSVSAPTMARVLIAVPGVQNVSIVVGSASAESTTESELRSSTGPHAVRRQGQLVWDLTRQLAQIHWRSPATRSPLAPKCQRGMTFRSRPGAEGGLGAGTRQPAPASTGGSGTALALAGQAGERQLEFTSEKPGS
jgi:hypothetical protein